MPQRGKVLALTPEVRKWLDKALADNNFAQYEQLSAELSKRGFAIGKSSLHRYGANLERRLAAIKASTHAANLIAEAAPDDADQRSAAIISLVQTEMFESIVALQEAADADPVERVALLSKAAKNIATLARASVTQKRWEIEIRARTQAAADKAANIAKKGGLTKTAVDAIRREILGIPTSG